MIIIMTLNLRKPGTQYTQNTIRSNNTFSLSKSQFHTVYLINITYYIYPEVTVYYILNHKNNDTF